VGQFSVPPSPACRKRNAVPTANGTTAAVRDFGRHAATHAEKKFAHPTRCAHDARGAVSLDAARAATRARRRRISV
jgi:hypothetical protein